MPEILEAEGRSASGSPCASQPRPVTIGQRDAQCECHLYSCAGFTLRQMSWGLLVLPARSVKFTDFHLQIRIYNLDNSVCEKTKVSRKKTFSLSSASPQAEKSISLAWTNPGTGHRWTSSEAELRHLQELIEKDHKVGPGPISGRKEKIGKKNNSRQKNLGQRTHYQATSSCIGIYQNCPVLASSTLSRVLWVYLPTWKLLNYINQNLN